MQAPHHNQVPGWVRNTVCLMAISSVPGLLIAAVLGVDVTAPLASVVALSAFRAATFVFMPDS